MAGVVCARAFLGLRQNPQLLPCRSISSVGEFVAQLTQPKETVRADLLLKEHGLAKRKHARQFLRGGRVTHIPRKKSSREPVLTGSTRVDPVTVHVDDEPMPYVRPLHLAMYKPAGVVCSHAEDEGPTVYDMLPGNFALRKPALQTIGRLDKATSGLLLLTQSGALNHRISAPTRKVPKVYKVRLAAPLCVSQREAAVFASGGLTLEDGTVCRPAQLEAHPRDPHWARVTLHEGAYHQVRRMFAAVGNAVVALHRDSVGPLSLGHMGLAAGDWRELTSAELYALVAATMPGLRSAGSHLKGPHAYTQLLSGGDVGSATRSEVSPSSPPAAGWTSRRARRRAAAGAAEEGGAPTGGRMSIAQAAASVLQGGSQPQLDTQSTVREFKDAASKAFMDSVAGRMATRAATEGKAKGDKGGKGGDS